MDTCMTPNPQPIKPAISAYTSHTSRHLHLQSMLVQTDGNPIDDDTLRTADEMSKNSLNHFCSAIVTTIRQTNVCRVFELDSFPRYLLDRSFEVSNPVMRHTFADDLDRRRDKLPKDFAERCAEVREKVTSLSCTTPSENPPLVRNFHSNAVLPSISSWVSTNHVVGSIMFSALDAGLKEVTSNLEVFLIDYLSKDNELTKYSKAKAKQTVGGIFLALKVFFPDNDIARLYSAVQGISPGQAVKLSAPPLTFSRVIRRFDDKESKLEIVPIIIGMYGMLFSYDLNPNHETNDVARNITLARTKAKPFVDTLVARNPTCAEAVDLMSDLMMKHLHYTPLPAERYFFMSELNKQGIADTPIIDLMPLYRLTDKTAEQLAEIRATRGPEFFFGLRHFVITKVREMKEFIEKHFPRENPNSNGTTR